MLESRYKKEFIFTYWGKCLFRSQVADLLAEHLNYDRRQFGKNIQPPQITNDKIMKCKIRPRVFLEEFKEDVGNDIPTRQRIMFGIINTLNNYFGQLIVDTNLRPQEIEEVYGEKDARRMRQCAWLVNYFTNKVTPPTDPEEIVKIDPFPALKV